MDTEVTIAQYTMFETGKKKFSPYIEILSEASNPQLGTSVLTTSLVKIMADKFNAMKDRQGKSDVMLNTRAVGRLNKEATNVIEVLSANQFANIKVPELVDYVTLQYNLPREEFENSNAEFFSSVMGPINEALDKAGLKMSDIDEIELLGGGVRVPKVMEILKKETGKDVGVKLNGDEAMCFGSAFMASNSSADFKVKQIFLTQHPNFDVHVKIMPLDPADALSVEEQKAEGIDEADIIKYT